MIRNDLIKILIKIPRSALLPVRCSSNKINIEKLEEESTVALEVDVVDDDIGLKEEALEQSRNKSRLHHHHRMILHEQNPYPEPMLWHHGTLKYLRRTYGRYGEASGINPAICWPTKHEISELKDYESVAYPYNILEVAEQARQKRKEKEVKIMARQSDIEKKMLKLEEWKQDLHNRIQRKENEAKAAKERKERLIEEVKAHFGYKVDPKDDKFKELLEKKEKEQKKVLKEERRQQKQAKMVDKLLKKNKNVKSEPVENIEGQEEETERIEK